MILIALFIGVIIIVAAFRNSQGALFSALYQDVPGFMVWAAAIFAIGAVGFIPGLKPVSRGLLALVITVIILNNYKNVIKGFEDLWEHPPEAAPAQEHTSGMTNSIGVQPGPNISGNDILSFESLGDFATSAGSIF
jgi:hypothetical protein